MVWVESAEEKGSKSQAQEGAGKGTHIYAFVYAARHWEQIRWYFSIWITTL